MLCLTARTNGTWPVQTVGNEEFKSQGCHQWIDYIPVLTALPIIAGDLGTAPDPDPNSAGIRISQHYQLKYENIEVFSSNGLHEILNDKDRIRDIIRKIGIGVWPIIVVDENDTKLERVRLIEHITVKPLDLFPHFEYEYDIAFKYIKFVNNSSETIHVPDDLIAKYTDDSDVSRICSDIYHIPNGYTGLEDFTDEDLEKFLVKLTELELDPDIGFLNGNRSIIRFHTAALEHHLDYYEKELNPDRTFCLNISRQIKDAVGTYCLIRKDDGSIKDAYESNLKNNLNTVDMITDILIGVFVKPADEQTRETMKDECRKVFFTEADYEYIKSHF